MNTTTTTTTTAAAKRSSTLYMVELAMMIAIILLMSFTPLGYLRTPGLSITLLTIPVAVGAIILGPKGGAVCGLAFGATSFYMAVTGSSAFAAALFNINPFGTFIVCIVARVLEGWITGLIFAARDTPGSAARPWRSTRCRKIPMPAMPWPPASKRRSTGYPAPMQSPWRPPRRCARR